MHISLLFTIYTLFLSLNNDVQSCFRWDEMRPCIHIVILKGLLFDFTLGVFLLKMCDIFLIYAQNIDCLCLLEPPH